MQVLLQSLSSHSDTIKKANGQKTNTNTISSLLTNCQYRKLRARTKNHLFVAALQGPGKHGMNSDSGCWGSLPGADGELTTSWIVQETHITHKRKSCFESCQEDNARNCSAQHHRSLRSYRYFWWYLGTNSLLRAEEEMAMYHNYVYSVLWERKYPGGGVFTNCWRDFFDRKINNLQIKPFLAATRSFQLSTSKMLNLGFSTIWWKLVMIFLQYNIFNDI